MIDITKKETISKEEVHELLETKEGRWQLFMWIQMQRLDAIIAMVWAAAGKDEPPNKETAERLRKEAWNVLFRVNAADVIETKALALNLMEQDIKPIDADDLVRMKYAGIA
jgi:hypothetical protein